MYVNCLDATRNASNANSAKPADAPPQNSTTSIVVVAQEPVLKENNKKPKTESVIDMTASESKIVIWGSKTK